jgi:hypothetical protein
MLIDCHAARLVHTRAHVFATIVRARAPLIARLARAHAPIARTRAPVARPLVACTRAPRVLAPILPLLSPRSSTSRPPFFYFSATLVRPLLLC